MIYKKQNQVSEYLSIVAKSWERRFRSFEQSYYLFLTREYRGRPQTQEEATIALNLARHIEYSAAHNYGRFLAHALDLRQNDIVVFSEHLFVVQIQEDGDERERQDGELELINTIKCCYALAPLVATLEFPYGGACLSPSCRPSDPDRTFTGIGRNQGPIRAEEIERTNFIYDDSSFLWDAHDQVRLIFEVSDKTGANPFLWDANNDHPRRINSKSDREALLELRKQVEIDPLE